MLKVLIAYVMHIFVFRDVCQNGFSDEVIGMADAVFLDLPHPHLVVPFAIKALKSTGKIRINNNRDNNTIPIQYIYSNNYKTISYTYYAGQNIFFDI